MRAARSKNAIMDLDRELTGIFREVVQFLECLREIKLPITLENLRNNLLIRSKQTLMTFTIERFGTRASPEPYLNMNPAAIRTKGLTPTIEKGGELEEYVGAEEPGKQKQQQDYYESFQTVEANHAAAAATATATATATAAPHASSSTSSSSSASNTASVSGMVASQPSQARDETIENPLMEIYASFSAAEAKSKCLKCGPLDRKEGKKLFVFEHYRTYWVGLVGSHLLIYENDRDSRPYMVLPIRGYMARAAPNANPRDQRRNESTFELFCPGSKTFQFVARTPKDMEQWVVKICEFSTVGKVETLESQKVLPAPSTEVDVPKVKARSSLDLDLDLDLDLARKEEQYQDVGCFGVDKSESEAARRFVGTVGDERTADSTTKNAHVDFANFPSCPVAGSPVSFPGPPLPARIPCRLPSLPVRGSSTSTNYVLQDEEEDDIYHKIEDLKNDTGARIHCYGNVALATKCSKESSTSDRRSKKNSVNGSRTETTYGTGKGKGKGKGKDKDKGKGDGNGDQKENGKENETDIGNTGYPVPALTVDNRIDERDESYDDVESLLSRSGPKPSNERPTIADGARESTKSPQKKSFLDRVRSLKESPRKIEKKTKGKTVTPPPVDNQRLSTYDNVSGLINVQQTKQSILPEEEKKKKEEVEEEEEEQEESEYTCPPPPRPIYTNPPIVADTTATTTTTETAFATATYEEDLYDDVASCRKNYKEQDTRQLDRVVETPTISSHVQESTRRKLDKSVSGDDIERPKSQASFEESEHYQTPRPNSNSNHREHPAAQQEELYDDIAILAEFTARQKEFQNSGDSEEAGEIRARASPEKRSWNRFVGARRTKATDSVAAQETNTARNSCGTDHVDDLVTTRMNTFQKLISKMENSLGKGPVKTTPTILPNRTRVTDNA